MYSETDIEYLESGLEVFKDESVDNHKKLELLKKLEASLWSMAMATKAEIYNIESRPIVFKCGTEILAWTGRGV